jgi:PrtD family type I secretion system ABC transporter
VSSPVASKSAPEQPVSLVADGIDAVLSENARRLRSVVGRWRTEDGDRPTALPLARHPDQPPLPAAATRVVPSVPDLAPLPTPAMAVDGVAAPAAPASVHAAGPSIAPATQPSTSSASTSSEGRTREQKTEPAPAAPTGPRRRRTALAADPAVEAAHAATTPLPLGSGAQAAAVALSVPVALPPPAALQQPPVHALAKRGEMWLALLASKRAIIFVGWFSCAINILMLAGPLFMLQVYDRVMASGSMATLGALLALTLAVYGIIGLLELARSRLVTRIGTEIDQRIGDRIFEAAMKSQLSNTGSPSGALRDLDTLRNFVAGPAPTTFFDVWWAPVYLLVIFATHWTLGLAATVGCAMLLFTAWLSDARSRAPLTESQKAAVRSMEMAETGQRNAEVLAAMGMIGAYRHRWQKLNKASLEWQMYSSDVLGGISSASKALRLVLQSVMLAIGAALALKGEISAGAIIAATIIFGRALAPVEQVITHWRSSLKAHDAYKKLELLLAAVPPSHRAMTMPQPKGHMEITGLRVGAPGSDRLILAGISFEVKPGQMLAVIGPSASGKSTLTRALVGLWAPAGGSIKLDGIEINRWDSEALGQHIGYLPQDMELFSGTVRENIGRFRADATDQEIIAAATAAHAHELVMSLPNGYATELGAFGTHLSGGQRQRIALARALFRNPAIVVLDEANANLDRAGDVALANAIDGMRKRGQAIIFVSHRVQIQQADTLLYIEKGQQKAFGPREQVLAAINGQTNQPEPVVERRTRPPQPAQPHAAPQSLMPSAPQN